MHVRWLRAILGKTDTPPMRPLYDAIVARGRDPDWYVAGAVPDTVDGRFDMIAAVLALVLIRLEREQAGAAPGAWLAERFVDDMDGQLRQIGFGDIVVGKHVGRMMGMLGGRVGAYRDALAAGDPAPTLDAALARNLYRGAAPAPAAVAHVRGALIALSDRLRETPVATLLTGTLP